MKLPLILLVLLIPFLSQAQNGNEEIFSKHNIYAEVGGLSLYSINYENVINPHGKLKIAVGAGGAYLPLDKDNKYYFSQMKFIVFLGKEPLYFGGGFDVVHVLRKYRYTHWNYDYGMITEKSAYVMPCLQFRYQPKSSGFFTTVSAYFMVDSEYTMAMDDYTDDMFNLYSKTLVMTPSASFGYTFNTHRKN